MRQHLYRSGARFLGPHQGMNFGMIKYMDTDDSRNELKQRGIPFSQEQFLRQVRSGNKEIVELFLRAGVSPNASLDGEAAVVVAAKAGHKAIVQELVKAGADPATIVGHFKSREDAKDFWEKLAALSGVFTFMSSILIAAVGWYFTHKYNQRQLDWTKAQAGQEQENKAYQNRLSELQAVEKLIPHLAKDESSKHAALVALSVLASPKLASRFAELYGGQGSVDALKQIATASPNSPTAPAVTALTNLAAQDKDGISASARDALATVLQGKEKAIVQLRIDDNQPICNGFVVDGKRGWILTAAYCLRRPGGDTTRQIRVQLWDGTRTNVRELKFTERNLLAFARIDAKPVQQLVLSSNLLRVGDSVTQLAFDFQTREPTYQLRVGLGRIIEAGPMLFIGATSSQPSAAGFKVALPSESTGGKAGAPLLDSEGNVACMTYQGGRNGWEQCIAAEEIRDALKVINKI